MMRTLCLLLAVFWVSAARAQTPTPVQCYPASVLTLTAANTAQTVLAPDARRKTWFVMNLSSTTLNIDWSQTATSSSFALVGLGSSFTWPSGTSNSQGLSVYGTVQGQAFYAVECR